MNKKKNLTKGNITRTLTLLALPIMGTSLINMLYNLTDMMWLGRLSTNAVAGAGTVGYFIWFGMGLVMISQVGAAVGVSQAYGREDIDEVRKYISHTIRLDLLIAIIYSFILFTFRKQIIGFFTLDNQDAVNKALDYMKIIAPGLIFHFINPVFSAIFNATGNSAPPFRINAVGLITNILLDPILIFGGVGVVEFIPIFEFIPGLHLIPAMGIKGAALATVTAQAVVTILFLIATRKNKELFSNLNLFTVPESFYIKRILSLGVPGFLQIAMHSGISMVIARLLSNWGAMAIAVQSVGSQIESISWMTAEGFATAITAFVGQNYGARNYDRVKKGYYRGLQIVSIVGTFAMFLFILGGEPIFSIFTPEDPDAILEGANYLRILGFSQIFICIEIASTGAFNGLGKTLPPALTGMIFNFLRIPGAKILSATALGLGGVWWSITISSIFKGVVTTALCMYVFKNALVD